MGRGVVPASVLRRWNTPWILREQGRDDRLPYLNPGPVSGAADPDRAERRSNPHGGTSYAKTKAGASVRAPFDTMEPSPGYIKGYPPGVRENGASIPRRPLARHGAGAPWDGERAAKVLRMLNPIEHARDPEAAWRYRRGALCRGRRRLPIPGRIGQGGWSWYTGSSAGCTGPGWKRSWA